MSTSCLITDREQKSRILLTKVTVLTISNIFATLMKFSLTHKIITLINK